MVLGDIINRCQLGDLDAFHELYRIYYKKAFGTAYLICSDRSLSEDIVQEAFIVCYKSIKQLKDSSLFNTWFYKIVVRLSWRMNGKQGKVAAPTSVDTSNIISFDCFISAENKLILRDSINQLSEPLKTVIVLYYYNDLSIRDISKITGCLEGTVKSRLYKARNFIKNSISEPELSQLKELEAK